MDIEGEGKHGVEVGMGKDMVEFRGSVTSGDDWVTRIVWLMDFGKKVSGEGTWSANNEVGEVRGRRKEKTRSRRVKEMVC